MTQDSDYLEMLDKFDKQAAKAFEPVRSEPLVCISETEYNKLAMTAATFKMALLYMRIDSRAIRLQTTERQHAEIMDRIDAALDALDALEQPQPAQPPASVPVPYDVQFASDMLGGIVPGDTLAPEDYKALSVIRKWIAKKAQRPAA